MVRKREVMNMRGKADKNVEKLTRAILVKIDTVMKLLEVIKFRSIIRNSKTLGTCPIPSPMFSVFYHFKNQLCQNTHCEISKCVFGDVISCLLTNIFHWTIYGKKLITTPYWTALYQLNDNLLQHHIELNYIS